jgi:pimeloyl-ACP methyl ester carboxylesterase
MRGLMLSNLKFLKWWGCAALVVASILLWEPLDRALFSVRFAASLQDLASGDTGQQFDIREAKVRRQFGGHSYEALTYFPVNSAPSKALVLVPGISELGCYHPRLMALSRLLADKGLLVVTPDIETFRKLQISADPLDQILFWQREIPALPGGENVRATGLAGISYAGTLALIAAARPEVRDRVAFVVAIGPYSNLERCTRHWFAAGPTAPGSGSYPTRFYAKWIIMLSALETLPSMEDRRFLTEVLNCLLLQKKVPAPAAPGLTPDGARWFRLATMGEDQSDPELAAEIQKRLVPRLYRRLDPESALSQLRCPVFLIHGAFDDLIPAGESMELHQRIPSSQLLISPFLTHTHFSEKPLSWSGKIAAGFDTIAFCYRFSRVIR